MDIITEYLKFFTGLIAIVNPIGAIPFFVAATANEQTAVRRQIARTAGLTVMLILLTMLFLGKWLLSFFGISIASFRVGGGLLILLMSVSMMQARLSGVKQTEEEAQEATDRHSIAVVPLGIPLLAGPGAISTVILYVHRNPSLFSRLVLGAEIFGISVIVWLVLHLAPRLAPILGQTGINIATRIMGLIMAAIGVEFIANGLRVLFPGLG